MMEWVVEDQDSSCPEALRSGMRSIPRCDAAGWDGQLVGRGRLRNVGGVGEGGDL